MRQSESVEAIATALVKARESFPSIHKDATNPHFKSKFASLSSISDTVMPSLLGQGITVAQGVGRADDSGLEVLTRLQHADGEWMENSVWMPLDKQNPQGAGSALTYGRRYGLSAMLGIVADDDDDGNAASAGPDPRAIKALDSIQSAFKKAGLNDTTDKEVRDQVQSVLEAVFNTSKWSTIEKKSIAALEKGAKKLVTELADRGMGVES